MKSEENVLESKVQGTSSNKVICHHWGNDDMNVKIIGTKRHECKNNFFHLSKHPIIFLFNP